MLNCIKVGVNLQLQKTLIGYITSSKSLCKQPNWQRPFCETFAENENGEKEAQKRKKDRKTLKKLKREKGKKKKKKKRKQGKVG